MKIREHLTNLPYLIRTGAPLCVIVSYYTHLLHKCWDKLHGSQAQSYTELMRPINEHGQFSVDWFDCNAAEWMKIIESEGLDQKPIEVLEIGSWEGKSTSFLLYYLKTARVTSVDTWQGSDEHQLAASYALSEQRFDANVSRFRDRLTKLKMSSHTYFANHKTTGKFDLIYVDGSHHSYDVMLDAMHCFGSLKVGGIMVFDDYLWRFYDRVSDNPAMVINFFLKWYFGDYKLLNVTQQIYIKKVQSLSLRSVNIGGC